MPTAAFSLPQSSWTEVRKMIDAYSRADTRGGGEPITLPEVARHAGMDSSWISRNNKFLQSIGVIEGKQRKRVTELGRSLGLAISHQDEGAIRSSLAKVVSETDFLSQILNAVAVRGGMDAPSLERHIAITAEAPKSPRSATGSKAVIQLLLEAGALADDNGTYRSGGVPDSPKQERDEETTHTVRSGVTQRMQPLEYPIYSWTATTTPREVTVNINLTISAENFELFEDFIRELTGLPRPSPADDADASS